MKMEQKSDLSIHNRFDFKLIDAETNEVKQEATAYNIVLDRFYQNSFTQTAKLHSIVLGGGSGVLDASRTELFQTLSSRIATERKINGEEKSVTIKSVWSTSDLAGEKIREVGVSFRGSNLVTHALIVDSEGNEIEIEKTDTEILEVYATVFFQSTEKNVNTNSLLRHFATRNGFGDNIRTFSRLTAIKGKAIGVKPLGIMPQSDMRGGNFWTLENVDSSLESSNGEVDDTFSYNYAEMRDSITDRIISGFKYNFRDDIYLEAKFSDMEEPQLFPVKEINPVIENDQEIIFRYPYEIEESEIVVRKNDEVLPSSEWDFNGNDIFYSQLYFINTENALNGFTEKGEEDTDEDESGFYFSDLHNPNRISTTQIIDGWALLTRPLKGNNITQICRIDEETLQPLSEPSNTKILDRYLQYVYDGRMGEAVETKRASAVLSPQYKKLMFVSQLEGMWIFNLDEDMNVIGLHKDLNIIWGGAFHIDGQTDGSSNFHMQSSPNGRFIYGMNFVLRPSSFSRSSLKSFLYDLENDVMIEDLIFDDGEYRFYDFIDDTNAYYTENRTLYKAIWDETEKKFIPQYSIGGFGYNSYPSHFGNYVMSTGKSNNQTSSVVYDTGTEFQTIIQSETSLHPVYKNENYFVVWSFANRKEFWIDLATNEVVKERIALGFSDYELSGDYWMVFGRPNIQTDLSGEGFTRYDNQIFYHNIDKVDPLKGNITLNDPLVEGDSIEVDYALKNICPKDEWNIFESNFKLGIQLGQGQ